jgi:hypothetical protein
MVRFLDGIEAISWPDYSGYAGDIIEELGLFNSTLYIPLQILYVQYVQGVNSLFNQEAKFLALSLAASEQLSRNRLYKPEQFRGDETQLRCAWLIILSANRRLLAYPADAKLKPGCGNYLSTDLNNAYKSCCGIELLDLSTMPSLVCFTLRQF